MKILSCIRSSQAVRNKRRMRVARRQMMRRMWKIRRKLVKRARKKRFKKLKRK